MTPRWFLDDPGSILKFSKNHHFWPKIHPNLAWPEHPWCPAGKFESRNRKIDINEYPCTLKFWNRPTGVEIGCVQSQKFWATVTGPKMPDRPHPRILKHPQVEEECFAPFSKWCEALSSGGVFGQKNGSKHESSQICMRALEFYISNLAESEFINDYLIHQHLGVAKIRIWAETRVFQHISWIFERQTHEPLSAASLFGITMFESTFKRSVWAEILGNKNLQGCRSAILVAILEFQKSPKISIRSRFRRVLSFQRATGPPLSGRLSGVEVWIF